MHHLYHSYPFLPMFQMSSNAKKTTTSSLDNGLQAKGWSKFGSYPQLKNSYALHYNLHKVFNNDEIPWVNLLRIHSTLMKNFLESYIKKVSFGGGDVLKLLGSYSGISRVTVEDGQTCFFNDRFLCWQNTLSWISRALHFLRKQDNYSSEGKKRDNVSPNFSLATVCPSSQSINC